MSEESYPTPPWPDPADPILCAHIVRGWRQVNEEGENPEEMIVSVASHGWMEGHIQGEASREPAPEPLFIATDDAPCPPFPSGESDLLADILGQELTLYRLRDGEDLGESLIAAATRCWAAGYAEGLNCPGCLPVGGAMALELRRRLRSGEIPVIAGEDEGPGEPEIFQAAVATYKDQLAARELSEI